MISVQNFSKTYKDSPAVTDFSMECKIGEIVGILGLNGAGKTTVLKAICARHFATKGKIVVNGLDASEETEKVRALTGFVTEQSDFPGELKVSEYLRMVFEIQNEFKNDSKKSGQSKKNKMRWFRQTQPPHTESTDSMTAHDEVIDQPHELESIKERFSLESVWNEKIKNLSKGFRERVNFSQALVHNPPVLVLDEPASGLDPAQIVRMRKTVMSLKKDHAIILSTHLMQEVDALCDRVYILKGGKCVASGTQEEIAKESGCASLEEAFFKLTES